MSDDEFSVLYNTASIAPTHSFFEEKNSVFVKYSHPITRQDLVDLFKPCGSITNINFKSNYSYVQFKDEKMKSLALKLTNSVIKGGRVLISNLRKNK